jgi:hypothetical protein
MGIALPLPFYGVTYSSLAADDDGVSVNKYQRPFLLLADGCPADNLFKPISQLQGSTARVHGS